MAKEIITMWHKDYRCDVDVFKIYTEGSSIFAVCFVPVLAGQQNGQGWLRVKMSKLIPYPHAETYKTGMSKTEKNKIKSMLTLSYAVWTCTDGRSYTTVEEAIQHQRELVEKNEVSSNDQC